MCSADQTRWYRDANGNFFIPVPTKRGEAIEEADPMSRYEVLLYPVLFYGLECTLSPLVLQQEVAVSKVQVVVVMQHVMDPAVHSGRPAGSAMTWSAPLQMLRSTNSIGPSCTDTTRQQTSSTRSVALLFWVLYSSSRSGSWVKQESRRLSQMHINCTYLQIWAGHKPLRSCHMLQCTQDGCIDTDCSAMYCSGCCRCLMVSLRLTVLRPWQTSTCG